MKGAHKCARCPASAEEGKSCCRNCLADAAVRSRAYYHKSSEELLVASLCIRNCGRPPIPGRRRCAPCLDKQREENKRNYKSRVERGQCVFCQGSATVGIFCFIHWLKNVGVPHGLGSKRGIATLRKLWEKQQGKCALTGENLVPGNNASIDHIIPKSRGGESVEGNLQWVLLSVNRIKWDMTREELLNVCRKIIKAQDAKEVSDSVEVANKELSKRSN